MASGYQHKGLPCLASRLSTQGTTMLGVPIDNRGYRRLIAERKLREMQPSTAVLRIMGPRIASSLLLQSINLRPLFMMSSDSNPDHIVEYVRVFDAHTVSTVAALLHTEVTDMLEYYCFLPPHLGGLGLIRRQRRHRSSSVLPSPSSSVSTNLLNILTSQKQTHLSIFI